MHRKIFFVIVGILAIVGIIALVTAQGIKKNESPRQIGFIAPLSGEVSEIGTTILHMAQLAVDGLNETQFKKNGTIDLIAEDGKCSGKDALTAAQKLIFVDKVKVIIFGGCSGEVLSTAPLFEKEKILGIATIAGSPEITSAGDYLFRMSLSDDKQIQFLASHMKQNGIRRVALISEQNEYAMTLRKTFQKETDQPDLELAADELYSKNSKDVRTQLLKVAETKPNALLIIPGGAVETTGRIVKQWHELGNSIPLYGTDQFTFGALLDEYAKYYQGMVVVQAKFDQSNPETKHVLDAFRKRYGSDCSLGLFCATTYDTVRLVTEALDECDQDTVCMKDYWYGIKNRPMTSGAVTIDHNGDAQFDFEYKKISGSNVVDL